MKFKIVEITEDFLLTSLLAFLNSNVISSLSSPHDVITNKLDRNTVVCDFKLIPLGKV